MSFFYLTRLTDRPTGGWQIQGDEMEWQAERSETGVVFTTGGTIERSDISLICRKVRAAIEETNADSVTFDMAALVHTDVVVVEALARLQLTLRRMGCTLKLKNVRPHLKELVGFVGLEGVLPLGG
jgi:anti-anti-sigma regulatory factor